MSDNEEETPSTPPTPVIQNRSANPPPAQLPPKKSPFDPSRQRRQVLQIPQAQEVDPFIATFTALVERAIGEGSEVAIELISFMEKYIVDMDPNAPRPLKGIPGADYQKSFYRMIVRVMEKSASATEFRKNWILLASFFWRYRKGALGEMNVNRFAEFWNNGDEDELKGYQNIVNLLLLTANPAERNKVKERCSIPRTLKNSRTEGSLFSDVARQNVFQFYGV